MTTLTIYQTNSGRWFVKSNNPALRDFPSLQTAPVVGHKASASDEEVRLMVEGCNFGCKVVIGERVS